MDLPPSYSTFPRVPRTRTSRPSSHPHSRPPPSQALSPLRNQSASVSQVEGSVMRPDLSSGRIGRPRADSTILGDDFSFKVVPESTILEAQDASLRRDSTLPRTTEIPTRVESPRQQRTSPTPSTVVAPLRPRAASTIPPASGRNWQKPTVSRAVSTSLPAPKRLPPTPKEHPAQLTGKWTSFNEKEAHSYIVTEPTWVPITLPTPSACTPACKPMKHPVKGICPHYPRDLEALRALDQTQLDQLARHYDQVYIPNQYTNRFPKKMTPWIGAPDQRQVGIETKRQRFADFIGLQLEKPKPQAAKNSLSESMKKPLPSIPHGSPASFKSADMRKYGFREKMKEFPRSGKSKMTELYGSVVSSTTAWQRPSWLPRQLFRPGEK